MFQLSKYRCTFGGWSMINFKEAVPIKADHRKDGTKLDDKCKSMHKSRHGGIILHSLRHTQQILGNNHMTC